MMLGFSGFPEIYNPPFPYSSTEKYVILAAPMMLYQGCKGLDGYSVAQPENAEELDLVDEKEIVEESVIEDKDVKDIDPVDETEGVSNKDDSG